jgi:RNA polymerase-binding transcription factor DksA
MKAIEFKSKLSKNRILIPKKIQSVLQSKDEKNVRVMIFWEEENEANDLKSYSTNEAPIDIANDELESINRGLKDIEDGKIHSNETARKLYEKYL